MRHLPSKAIPFEVIESGLISSRYIFVQGQPVANARLDVHLEVFRARVEPVQRGEVVRLFAIATTDRGVERGLHELAEFSPLHTKGWKQGATYLKRPIGRGTRPKR